VDSMFARIVRRSRQPASDRRSCPLPARNATLLTFEHGITPEPSPVTPLWGQVCYDTVPPVTTAVLAGPRRAECKEVRSWSTLTATDATNGVSGTAYRLDDGL
jgi:hypothetical protein